MLRKLNFQDFTLSFWWQLHSLIFFSRIIMASQLTCIACRQIFQNIDDQRAHYKTDLHRFNLKRKVASLPPVTEDVFQKKLSEVAPADEQDSKYLQYLEIIFQIINHVSGFIKSALYVRSIMLLEASGSSTSQQRSTRNWVKFQEFL